MNTQIEEKAVETWADDGGRTATNSTDRYAARTFQIPKLKGISRKNIDEHLALYDGYVKYSNHIARRISELPKDEGHAYELTLLQRRFAYEYDGMKHHETFFEQFEGGPQACTLGGPLLKQITGAFETFDAFIACLKGVAMTRGVGWMMLYFCNGTKRLIPQWVDEHHLGLLSGPTLILALDMWEHAFVYDYATSEKTKYVEAFFGNLNWTKVEDRLGM